jgi:hypothetical protein
MLARGLLHQILTTIFKALAAGVQQVQGFGLVDTSSSEDTGFRGRDRIGIVDGSDLDG